MPDKDGWHDEAFAVNGRMFRWHYCPASDTDTLVEDTRRAKVAHVRTCRAQVRAARRAASKDGRARSDAALAKVNRDRGA